MESSPCSSLMLVEVHLFLTVIVRRSTTSLADNPFPIRIRRLIQLLRFQGTIIQDVPSSTVLCSLAFLIVLHLPGTPVSLFTAAITVSRFVVILGRLRVHFPFHRNLISIFIVLNSCLNLFFSSLLWSMLHCIHQNPM